MPILETLLWEHKVNHNKLLSSVIVVALAVGLSSCAKSPENKFLSAVREADNSTSFADRTDFDLLRLGDQICERLASGESLFEITLDISAKYSQEDSRTIALTDAILEEAPKYLC